MVPENSDDSANGQANGKDHKVYDLADARRKQRTIRPDGRKTKPTRQGGSGAPARSGRLWSFGGVVQLVFFLGLLWWTMSLCSGRGF